MRRVLKLSLLILIFTLIEIFNYLGFFLDHILYPTYRKVTIRSPIFIIGMPRSATTYLHVLLANDTQHFTSMRMWEILLAPSIVQKKLLLFLAKIDKRYNHVLLKFIIRIDKRIYMQYSPIHPMSFFNIEEDEYLFFHIFTTGHLLFWFPSIKRLYKTIKYDQAFSEQSKKRHFRFYKSCIQRHLYVFGNDRIYLAKSPSHTPRIQTLKKVFPDLKLIHLVRLPHETIPSTISLFQMFCKIFKTPSTAGRLTNWVLEIADFWYSYPFRLDHLFPDKSIIHIRFGDLTTDPSRLIKVLYSHLKINVGNEYKSLLGKETESTKDYISTHHYTLSQYNLTEEQLRNKYKSIYHEYFTIPDRTRSTVSIPMVQDR